MGYERFEKLAQIDFRRARTLAITSRQLRIIYVRICMCMNVAWSRVEIMTLYRTRNWIDGTIEIVYHLCMNGVKFVKLSNSKAKYTVSHL